MQYLLTQEELDLLAGNKQKLIEEANTKLEEKVREFGIALNKVLKQHGARPEELMMDYRTNGILQCVKQAMHDCKILITKEPQKPSPDLQPGA